MSPPGPSAQNARVMAGLLMFALVAFIVGLDAFRTDFEVNPLVLVPIVVGGAALLGVRVDLPK